MYWLEAQITKALRCFRWLPAYTWQRATRREPATRPLQLIIGVADHFEPSIVLNLPGVYADRREQERRVRRWCIEYPKVVDPWRDSDGRPFRHTYFYPAEQYDPNLIALLTEHCHAGWGEIEIHLHHGVKSPDTAENTRKTLVEFRDALVTHGCLSRWDGTGQPRYAFVHGNFALANSAGGRLCGVDEEMQILAETGCYADLTLPSAPGPAQIGKINAIYECAAPLDKRAPHRRGRDLRCGRGSPKPPLIIQGPLGFNLARKNGRFAVPCIENGALTTSTPPTMQRLRLWRQANITVKGRPEWVFVKLHCHGMDPRDEPVMLGELMQRFLEELIRESRSGDYRVHFVTAREMVNIILAACDGQEGNPGDYRDYRLRLITPARGA